MNTSATFRPLITAAFLLALTAPAIAQVPDRVSTGDWVRVEMLGKSYRVEGRLMSLNADSLVVARGDSATNRVAVARANVTNVWVSVGQKRRLWQGIGIGLGVGAGIGGLIGAVTYEPCVSDEFLGCLMAPESAGQAALLGGAVGGIFGIVIGGIAGFTTKRHEWEPIGVPTTVGVTTSGYGRVAVAVRLNL